MKPIFVKSLIVVMILFALSQAQLRADWAFNEMRDTLEGGGSYDKVRAIQNKFLRRIISGDGYVFLIRKADSINAYEVHLVEEYDESKLASRVQGDVCVVIPDGSTNSQVVEKLVNGQRVSFSGKVDRIFGKTIYLQGSAEVTPK
ncbi:MAG: hypothetical protein ABH875_01565 [Candidatus Omnitrophota bacterium]